MNSVSRTWLSEEDWAQKIDAADRLARSCSLCPRACGVDRFADVTGFCGAPGHLVVSSIFPHHGEEPPLSGTCGSGTIFFSHCTLRCDFCQNHQISWGGEGRRYSPEELAGAMIGLQEQRCHNINLVTADHFLPWVLRAIWAATRNGLSIPIVYNCSGYESVESLGILESVVDIYLPDMKYGDNAPAALYSHAGDYVEHNRAAIRTMFRQVGALKTDDEGIALRGLCIRHLVLPEGRSNSLAVADFLLSTFDPADISVSLMAQYRPLHQACIHEGINRPLTADDYEPIKRYFIDHGFDGFFQAVERLDSTFVIDFAKRKSERLAGSGE